MHVWVYISCLAHNTHTHTQISIHTINKINENKTSNTEKINLGESMLFTYSRYCLQRTRLLDKLLKTSSLRHLFSCIPSSLFSSRHHYFCKTVESNGKIDPLFSLLLWLWSNVQRRDWLGLDNSSTDISLLLCKCPKL